MITEAVLSHLVWASMATWILGALILLILQLTTPHRETIKSLWPVYFSEAAILGAGIVLIVLPNNVAYGVIFLVALRMAFEAHSVFMQNRMQSLITKLVWLLIYPITPFFAFALSFFAFESKTSLLLTFLLVEIFDSFALLGGKLWGKHKILPTLSPNKSLEGYITALIALTIAITLLAQWFDFSFGQSAVLLVGAALGATLGDLAASYQKRSANVKDYPALWSKQGGVLDIYDSWLLAGPLSLVLLSAL